MDKDQAIDDMCAGYRIGISGSGFVRWRDRDGTFWWKLSASPHVVLDESTMMESGYIRLPFTQEDAERWLGQGGWLKLGPSGRPNEKEEGRRFRLDFGDFKVRVEDSSQWETIRLYKQSDDQFAPVQPDWYNRTPSKNTAEVRVRTRFEIIEDF
jgi:hypothetical protein